MKVHEYIPYDLGVVSQTQRKHYMDFRHWAKIPGHNIKTELAKVVFFLSDMLCQYDLAICEVS